MNSEAPALVVSISGIRDDRLLDVARFATALTDRGVVPSLLVAPHAGSDWSLRNSQAVMRWIRRREAEGSELLLAGFDQTDKGRRGEFAALGEHEARLRLTAATRQMQALGLNTDMFAPPRWNLSRGTKAVLPDLGYRIAADLNGVHDLVSGTVDATRVVAFGEGFGAAGWWRRAVAATIERNIDAGRSIRLSVSASRLSELKVRRDALRTIDYAVNSGAVATGYRTVPLTLAA